MSLTCPFLQDTEPDSDIDAWSKTVLDAGSGTTLDVTGSEDGGRSWASELGAAKDSNSGGHERQRCP